MVFFLFKQKTAYEMRISDWSSDVCSSDLLPRHSGLSGSVRALTSRQSERDLAAFELDAGLTYLDFEPPAHALSVPLYVERSMLISAVDGVPIPEPLDWADLARLPLCLLHQGMQNRRILDARLAERGLALRPRVPPPPH